MLLSGPHDPLNYLHQINYYFQLFIFPVTTHLLPLPLYNPIPSETVTYVDNYRCFTNY